MFSSRDDLVIISVSHQSTYPSIYVQVVEVVSPLRDRLSACLIFPSMPEVMRLNKVGSFTMNSMGSSKSIIGDFMKSKKKEGGSGFEEGLLKLLRTLPKVLKYLPSDKAQDARSFIMSFQYWLGGSPDNIESMLLMLANTYVSLFSTSPHMSARSSSSDLSL